jgi:rubredoxin
MRRARSLVARARSAASARRHRCRWCGHVYDPAAGDTVRGIPPGTAFAELPDDWRCPDCRAPKPDFEPMSD